MDQKDQEYSFANWTKQYQLPRQEDNILPTLDIPDLQVKLDLLQTEQDPVTKKPLYSPFYLELYRHTTLAGQKLRTILGTRQTVPKYYLPVPDLHSLLCANLDVSYDGWFRTVLVQYVFPQIIHAAQMGLPYCLISGIFSSKDRMAEYLKKLGLQVMELAQGDAECSSICCQANEITTNVLLCWGKSKTLHQYYSFRAFQRGNLLQDK